MISRLLIIILIFTIAPSCSKTEKIYEPSKKINPYILYKEALDAFKINDYFNASKKFSEAELNFESVELAAKSSLMSSFSLYGINFYEDALENIDNFIKTYPADKNIMYAEYLKAVIFFEQMSDEKKDIKPLIEANKQIDYFLKKYPDTDYSIDLKFKKDLIQNQLAAKELFVAKYYISVKKWVPAINRLKNILENYDKTIFIEEALHRLVEINYHIGLKEEANKYASILGYNYNSSEWFKQSYKILNKEYVFKDINQKEIKREKDNIIKRIIKRIK